MSATAQCISKIARKGTDIGSRRALDDQIEINTIDVSALALQSVFHPVRARLSLRFQ